jgi:hypothetical protein
VDGEIPRRWCTNAGAVFHVVHLVEEDVIEMWALPDEELATAPEAKKWSQIMVDLLQNKFFPEISGKRE